MMALIQIVNDRDELVDNQERNEVDYKNSIYRSSALWVINSRGEALIAQRKLTKDRDPGKWGPSVAGTLESGETYESNVRKEAEEEIGLTGYALEELEKVRFDDQRHQFMQWYLARVDQPSSFFTPQPEEVERVEWVGIENLKKDLAMNPEKYVPSMSVCLDILLRGLNK